LAARYFLPQRRPIMMSTVIGGAMLPHAPQFFTMPDTEDKALVAHVREVADDVDKRLRALEPDLWIIFSNDHAEQFFHTTAPPFTVMWEAKRLANLPAGNSIGRFRARSPSSSCANFTGRISIRPSPRRPRSITPPASRSALHVAS